MGPHLLVFHDDRHLVEWNIENQPDTYGPDRTDGVAPSADYPRNPR